MVLSGDCVLEVWVCGLLICGRFVGLVVLIYGGLCGCQFWVFLWLVICSGLTSVWFCFILAGFNLLVWWFVLILLVCFCLFGIG